jgi:hypothetical protein
MRCSTTVAALNRTSHAVYTLPKAISELARLAATIGFRWTDLGNEIVQIGRPLGWPLSQYIVLILNCIILDDVDIMRKR